MTENPAGKEEIDAAVLTWPRVVAGSVFGSPGYYVKGHAFAFWQGDALVLKLPPEERTHALRQPGARRYTAPRGSAADWVLVPCAGAAPSDLLRLLAAACRFLGGEPALASSAE